MLRRPPSLLSRFRLVILLYVMLAVTWVWRLQPAFAHAPAVLRTQRLEQLTRYLIRAPKETLPSLLVSVARLDDEKLALIERWLEEPPLQQLRQLTVEHSAMLEKTGTLRDALLLGWLGQTELPSPISAHLMIAAAGDKLDDTMRLFAFQRLADHALRLDDDDAVQVILMRACELPNVDWKMVQEFVRISQLQGQNNAAILTLERWIARQDQVRQQIADTADAHRLLASLLLRTDRATEALDPILELLKAQPPHQPLPARDLELALVCAHSAERSLLIQPWLERQLSFFPEDTLTPEELLQKNDISPDYLHWLAENAAIADAALPASQAYAACLRLVAVGERSALARLCALAQPAKRDAEAEAFLHRVLIQQPVLRPALLELAQTDKLARKVVTTALQQRPDDRDLHFAMTLAASAKARAGTVATLWLSYLRRFPGDQPASRRLIQAYLLASQPHFARRVYDDLDPQTLTAEDRHQIEVLSQL